MAIVVLLGAGASFGSLGVEPYEPPLGNGLFPELVKKNGVAAAIPEHIKQSFESNFETGMAEYYEHTNGNIMSFQRELAEYLANFKPTESSVYIELIKSLGCNRVIYSSLNYDLLFEQSAGNLGLFTNYDVDNVQGGVRLLKFHGSSNFWPNLPTGMLKNCQFSGSVRADIQAPVKPLNRLETLAKCELEDSVAPAIAMFAVGKKVKISPDYVERQYDLWKEQVTKSSQIFVVGVRVHEVDEHIWGLLGSTKGKVTYFGFDGDKPEFEQWKNNNNKKNAYFYNNNFEESVQVMKRLSGL
ncbi:MULTISPECIES: hypothetical protein [Vibrio]|uniref:hypothetical protein n=1 Tax=Vibrio TaxID=662 RepID=UPI00030C8CA0|nr:hypothetical protein [Vibrio crassostreae]OED76212.1 hypothetical protein A141_21960 [Vibrio crassostreae ZF-91]